MNNLQNLLNKGKEANTNESLNENKLVFERGITYTIKVDFEQTPKDISKTYNIDGGKKEVNYSAYNVNVIDDNGKETSKCWHLTQNALTEIAKLLAKDNVTDANVKLSAMLHKEDSEIKGYEFHILKDDSSVLDEEDLN